MKAILVESVGHTGVHEMPIPDLADDEVLIRAEYVGICGSDFHVFTGKHEFRKPPVVAGHELAGIVEKIGPKVQSIRPGNRVTVLPQVGCGECRFCRNNRPMLCGKRVVPGTEKWTGSFVEYFNAPESAVFKLPDNLDTKTAILAEPLAVSCHCVGKISEENKPGLLILGVGSVGMLALAAARKQGVGKILVTDVAEYNLETALTLGADGAVNVAKDDLAEASRKLFGEDGPSAVILTAGGETAMQQALNLAGRGATIVYVAMITSPVTLLTRPIVAKELSFVGSRTYSHDDFQNAMDLLASDVPLFSSLVTHVFPLESVQDGFELMASRREGFVKIVVAM